MRSPHGDARRYSAVQDRPNRMAASRAAKRPHHQGELGGLKSEGQHFVDPKDQQRTPLLGR